MLLKQCKQNALSDSEKVGKHCLVVVMPSHDMVKVQTFRQLTLIEMSLVLVRYSLNWSRLRKQVGFEASYSR